MEVEVIAHRGDLTFAVENTVDSVNNAIRAGICNIEIDIQLSSDGVPVLYHDRTLKRLCNDSRAIKDIAYAKLDGRKITNSKTNLEGAITSLSTIASLVAAHPDVTLFVEIKRINFHKFTYRKTLALVEACLENIASQVVLISFSYRFLRTLQLVDSKSNKDFKIGYVLPTWQHYNEKMLQHLSPDYIFSSIDIVPEIFDFKGAQESVGNSSDNSRAKVAMWALYEIENVETAHAFVKRGVKYLETFESVKLSQSLAELSST